MKLETFLLSIIFFSTHAFSQPTLKRITVKFNPTVHYNIDYSQNKINVNNESAESIFTRNNLFKITSLLNQYQKPSQNINSTELIKNIQFLQFFTDRPIAIIISELNSTNLFEYVEEDFIGTASGIQSITPNDTYFNRQWGLLNNGTFNAQATVGADVKMTDAWSITTGTASTIVCVLDGGAKLNHPEFAGRIWVNSGEIPNNSIDDDSNGYIDDYNGWDWAYNDKDPTDDYGHGTNVAGIIGANSNNNTGYAGVNWNCKLMIGKILNNTNTGFYSWWISGIYYAVAKGAKIINMSVGGSGFSQAMKDACDFAYNNNVSILACMMNTNNNTTYYPAGNSSTIAIGATTINDYRANPFAWGGGSNYGAHIDVVAPGNFIYGLSYNSDINYNTYWSGTSQATPLVAGIVSLLYGIKPSLTVSEVRSILRTTANDMVGNPSEDIPGFDQYMGYGRVNAPAALTSSILIASPVVNDDAPGAILLTVDAGCTGSPFSNAGASQSGSEPFAACKGTAGYKTVWYKFSAPASGNVKVTNDYSGGTMGSDSRLALFSVESVNNYATFSNLACDDDNGVIIPDKSVIYATGLTPGNTYYIQVDGKDVSTATGTFCLTVDDLTSSMISTATVCASGQPLTSVNNNYTGWHSVTDANGKLIALINIPSGGATTSTYTTGQNINGGSVRTDPVSLQKYLDRNYIINNTTVSIANVQFFFLSSELAALQIADPGVTPANLQATRQTGNTCDNDFVAANGTNSSLTQTGNGTGTGFNWIQVQTPGFSKFYLHTKKAFLPVKTFLQGAYNAAVSRHKDITATWAAVLNANALSQPYSIAPYSYTGSETVSAGFFTSTTATTDITDWLLLELRDAITPATVITSRAAFIREDGRIVDLDGVSDVSFRNVANGNYHLVIRHRNHLNIRTATGNERTLYGTMGTPVPASYDFSTAQLKAYQNMSITSNEAMKDITGVFVMWGGNGNSDGQVRSTGLASQNDYLFLISALGNNPATVINNVYSRSDLDMTGTIRASGLSGNNDYLFLIGALGNNPAKVVNQHQ